MHKVENGRVNAHNPSINTSGSYQDFSLLLSSSPSLFLRFFKSILKQISDYILFYLYYFYLHF